MTSSSNDKSDKEEEEDDNRVVVEQNLLRLSECFIYRIPPMRSSGGHRAEDWNLSKALATCALEMTQRDDILLIRLLSSRPKNGGPTGATEQYLFAQSKIKIPPTSPDGKESHLTMQHYVESVVDSSRYFVLRIQDEQTNRELNIGLGFRERNDAMDFKMGLMEYQKDIEREQLAEQLQKKYGNEENENGEETRSGDSEVIEGVGRLSFKEGEKIHMNLSTNGSPKMNSRKKSSSKGVGKGGLLLRKPPPSSGGPIPSSVLTKNGDESQSDDNVPQKEVSVDDDAELEDDDFGEFESF